MHESELELETSRHRIATLEKEANAAAADRERLVESFRTQRLEIDNSMGQRIRLNADLESAHSLLEEGQARLNALGLDRDGLQARLTELQIQLGTVTDERDAARRELAARPTTDQLTAMTAERDTAQTEVAPAKPNLDAIWTDAFPDDYKGAFTLLKQLEYAMESSPARNRYRTLPTMQKRLYDLRRHLHDLQQTPPAPVIDANTNAQAQLARSKSGQARLDELASKNPEVAALLNQMPQS